jgi:hypothetical protein
MKTEILSVTGSVHYISINSLEFRSVRSLHLILELKMILIGLCLFQQLIQLHTVEVTEMVVYVHSENNWESFSVVTL